jgi:hypothetical protein
VDLIAEAGLDAYSVIATALMWICAAIALFIVVALVADGLMGRTPDSVIEDAMLGNGASDTAELAASDTQEIQIVNGH